ncbi:MAG: hypothetical protein AAGF11_08215 [Myxococcota bacterium]
MNDTASLAFLTVSLAVVGCYDGSESDSSDGSDSAVTLGTAGTNPGTETSDGDGTADGASTSADDESSSDDGSLPPPEGVLAGGIAVDTVAVNQGVGISIVEQGALLSTDARVAPVIAGRPGLIRASYQLAPDFAPRAIVGRLWLRNGPDLNAVYTEERLIDGPPDWSDIDGTFHWVVEPEDLTAQTEFRVQFLEVDDNGEPVGDITGSEFPAGEFAPLDAWGDRMVIDLMLVPFTCAGYPDLVLDPVDLADFEAFLFNTMPVQALVLTVHDPVPSASCSEFDAAEIDLPALREAEGADPWVYYGGLLPGDGGGYSIAIEDSDQMDFRRTFANHAWRDYGLTADLFAHELGHNHGRDHTFEDPTFPGDVSSLCGTTDTYGWGPRSSMMPSSGYSNDLDLGLSWFDPHEELLLPTSQPCSGLPDGNRYNFNDMMSYVYPYWVSAYNYAALAERVRLISTWSAQDKPAPPSGRTLRLVIGPEGDVHRTSHKGARPVTEPDTWATCGDERVPVRTTRTWLERPTSDGPLERFEYRGFELPLPVDVDPATCVLDHEGSPVPFTVR